MNHIEIPDSLENCVRKIDGREYVAALTSRERFMVQDFIRFPAIIPLKETPGVGSGMVDVILRNSTFASASSLTIGGFRGSIITGDPDFPVVVNPDHTAIGVRRAIFSELVTHAVGQDPNGEILPHLKNYTKDDIPIGIFHITTHPQVTEFWRNRSAVGIFRSPSGSSDFIRSIANGIVTELYDNDDAMTAVHFAISNLRSKEIYLHQCDASVTEERPGMIAIEGRWIWPEQEIHLRSFHALCHVALRNDIKVFYTKDTMVPVPGATAIDKSSLEA